LPPSNPRVRAILAVLDGAAFFQDILNDLTADLVRAENAQILSGSGVAPNLEGLTVVAGTQTQARGTDSNMDAVLKAQTKLRTGPFLEPTDVILHPNNFETVRLAKGSDGTYILGNPLSQDRPSLGGARLHITTDMTAGTGLVMNSGGGTRLPAKRCPGRDRNRARGVLPVQLARNRGRGALDPRCPKALGHRQGDGLELTDASLPSQRRRAVSHSVPVEVEGPSTYTARLKSKHARAFPSSLSSEATRVVSTRRAMNSSSPKRTVVV